MALVIKNRVKEIVSNPGSGTITFSGVSSVGYQPFSVIGDGNTCYYCIEDQGGYNWEVGIGTYTLAGNTLTRTTILSSSNANALVTFTAGDKNIFETYPAEYALLGSNQSLASTGTGSVVLSDSPTFTTAITATGALQLTGTFTAAQNIATNQVSGALTIGGATGTGALTFGRSTQSQIINIGTGVTSNLKTKTINIGTGVSVTPTVNINIGQRSSGGITNLNLTATNLNLDGTLITFTTSSLLLPSLFGQNLLAVADLPIGGYGAYRAMVTDASNPVVGTTVVGGGTTTTPVYNDGTNWICDSGTQTNITGNAATVTTNANLTGVVTSVGNATSIADASLTIAKTSGLQSTLDAKALQDGTILYHSTKWFIPSSTVSSSGTTVTSIGTQFTSIMVGAKLTINGESKLITVFTNSTTVTVASAYSINYSGVVAGSWGVFSRFMVTNRIGVGASYNVTDFYSWTGITSFIIDGSTFSIDILRGSSNNVNYNTNELILGGNRSIIWTNSVSGANEVGGTRDTGLRRNASGVLEIYDGAIPSGLVANRRDLLVRNLTASIISTINYTVATLPSASTSGIGAMAFVTDALAPTFGATVVTGGTVPVPVYSDGTNWKVG